MKKQILIGLVIGLGVLAVLGVIKFLQIQSFMAGQAQMGPPPQAVTTAIVEEQEWEQLLSTIGELAPIRGAELAFQASGVIRKISFSPGETVPAGKLLAQLDVSVEEAELAASNARLKLTEQEYERYERLLKGKATSRSEFEKRLSEYRAEEAKFGSLQSTINRRTIIAPFQGTLGTQKMALGEYANAGQSVVTLVDLSELYVNFTLPERYTLSVRVGDQIRFRTEATPEETFEAKVTSLESMVASSTRNISLQAKAENKSGILKPGMFVEVDIILPKTAKFPTVPVSSIQFAPYGNSVYVLSQLQNQQGKSYTGVLSQNVRLGEQRGDRVAVLQGVEPGQEVVSSGTFKLFPTAPVIVNNSVTPSDSLNPNPPNT